MSKRGCFNFRDIKAMSAKLGTRPLLLDAVVASSVPGGPVGGQTRIQLKNDHLSYLLTWWVEHESDGSFSTLLNLYCFYPLSQVFPVRGHDVYVAEEIHPEEINHL